MSSNDSANTSTTSPPKPSPMKPNSLLNQFLQQYRQKHQSSPRAIVVTPAACLALGIKDSLTPRIEGVPVVCRMFDEKEVVESGPVLGVFCRQNEQIELRSCDLQPTLQMKWE